MAKSTQELFVTKPTFYNRSQTFKFLLILVIVAFATLTILAKQYAYFAWDLQITLAIQKLNFPWFDLPMKFLTWLGDYMMENISILAVAALLFIIKKNKTAMMLMISAYGAKRAKDIAAAAVLVGLITELLVGLLIFLPHLTQV